VGHLFTCDMGPFVIAVVRAKGCGGNRGVEAEIFAPAGNGTGGAGGVMTTGAV
jgi:hypothetical protein